MKPSLKNPLPPHLVVEWHPTKNGKLYPEDVSASSGKKVWWECTPKKHAWPAKISNRASLNQGCPGCDGRMAIIGETDLATTHPILAGQWHPTKNSRGPETVTAGSGYRATWICNYGHDWTVAVDQRARRNTGCPVCYGRVAIVGENDLPTTHPNLMLEWHWVKNKRLPTTCKAGSNYRAHWVCQTCQYEWPTQISNRTLYGKGCPACGHRVVVIGVSDLATTDPSLAAEWHPTKNGDLTPQNFRRGSTFMAWWHRDSCGHDWPALISSRSQGMGCGVCSGSKIMVGVTDLATTHPRLAAEWHEDNDRTPQEVTRGSQYVAMWRCTKAQHVWSIAVSTRAVNGNGCSACSTASHRSRGEEEIFEFLSSLGLKPVSNTRTVLNGKELDIYLPEKKLAIEYNGLYWHSEAVRGKSFHREKWQAAKTLGIQLVQVWEDDWRDRPDTVRAMLRHKLSLSEATGTGARCTVVQELTYGVAADFLSLHHIEGAAEGDLHLGLRSKRGGALLAVLTVQEQKRVGRFEVVRYATAVPVAGGFTKLLAAAERLVSVSTWVGFADHTVSAGGLYIAGGFTTDKELTPDYVYMVNGRRYPKSDYSLERFETDKNLTFEAGRNEYELADMNGIARIWDAGRTRYIRHLR